MSDTEAIDFSPHFVLKINPESATVLMRPTVLALPRDPLLENVKSLLKSKGVIFGIDDLALEKMLQERIFNVDIPAAKSQLPVAGTDAEIEILVSPERKAKPRILADGTADYKEIDSIVQVKLDTVLARKHERTLGTPGMDIFGKALLSPPSMDANLPGGLNTRVGDDHVTLLAAKAGYLFRQTGLLCIGEILKVPGDVDFKSGNIHFEGDVDVGGRVAEGFTVEAAGNISIGGEADGAVIISQSGKVTLNSGVFGNSKGRIEAKQDVRLIFAQQCSIKCGHLFVEKSLQECEVEAYGIESTTPDCLFFGGKYLCYGSATFHNLGSEGTRTEILILDEQEEAYRRDLARLEKESALLQTGIEVYDKKLRSIKAILAKATDARIPPKVAQEIKTSSEAFQKMRRGLTNIQSRKTIIETELAKPRERSYTLKIMGEVQGTVLLNMFHIKKLLGPADSRKELSVAQGKGLVEFDIRK